MKKSLEEMNESLEENHSKEMNKTVQDLKMEMQSIRKSQTEGILKMKNIEMQRETTKLCFMISIHTRDRQENLKL